MNQGGRNAAPDYTAWRTSLCGIFAAYFMLDFFNKGEVICATEMWY